MPTYVDVGVPRVQEYIARTSGADEGQLRKRRGASRMVTSATNPATFRDLGLIVNPESYTVEGVAHLRVADGVAEPPEDLVQQALRRMREALPAAYLQASWVSAGDYREAREALRSGRDRGDVGAAGGVVSSLPATRDDPYQATCRSCGVGTVSAGADCEDCRRRDIAGANTGRSGEPATPEEKVLARLAHRLGRELKVVRDLDGLARLPVKPDAKRNHLATVYADGNGVGAIFEGITDPEDAKTVSAIIDEAIRSAGEEAYLTIAPLCRSDVLPGVVTALAADDALVTLPASVAWPFVTSLIVNFRHAITSKETTLRRILGTDALPSLTAGVAFFPVKSPIEQAIQTAFSAMTDAKRQHRGAAAVGWADRTHPGSSGSQVRLVDWVLANAARLDRLAVTPASQRAKWETDLRLGGEAGISQHDLAVYLHAEARRLGQDGLVDLGLDDLAVMLNIVRWWPPPLAGGGT